MWDTAISNANATLAMYQNTFVIGLISADTIIGQTQFTLASVTGLAISQQVKVMDNASIVYTRTIDNIIGNVVYLDSSIPVALTASNQARIVRQK